MNRNLAPYFSLSLTGAVIALIVSTKIFHYYPPKQIFKWTFLLPYVALIFSFICLFLKNQNKSLHFISIVFALLIIIFPLLPKIIATANGTLGIEIPVDLKMNREIHEAAKKGDTQKISGLLDAGTEIDIKNKEGETALQVALDWKNAQVAKLLIENGADFKSYNKTGDMPLHQAALNGQDKVVRLLIDQGANANIRTIKKPGYIYGFTGSTPLMLASAGGHSDIVAMLLSAGADPNLFNDQGYSALHVAPTPEICEILLNSGISVNISHDRTNKTPLDYAKKDEVKQFLIKHGGRKTKP